MVCFLALWPKFDLTFAPIGTWTKVSPNIRARRPFGKDESLDYDYDSGEDWEDEGDGEVIVSDGSDEDDSDSDEEEEGWLVDDEEVEETPGEDAVEAVEGSTSKRKANPPAKNKDAKRRKMEKLAAFQKGPCWETEIGQCSYEPFSAYRIQLLNGALFLAHYLALLTRCAGFTDCPYPVNPFTFTSDALHSATTAVSASGSGATQPGGTFAVPVPPAAANEVGTSGLSGPANRVVSVMKKSVDPTNIKNPFPVAHLAELYSLIEGSEKTLKGLVEDLHLALKRHPGVKKYAIEAKLREVADKGRAADAASKRWRVSDEAWVSASSVIYVFVLSERHVGCSRYDTSRLNAACLSVLFSVNTRYDILTTVFYTLFGFCEHNHMYTYALSRKFEIQLYMRYQRSLSRHGHIRSFCCQGLCQVS
jgi:hypothetical protein